MSSTASPAAPGLNNFVRGSRKPSGGRPDMPAPKVGARPPAMPAAPAEGPPAETAATPMSPAEAFAALAALVPEPHSPVTEGEGGPLTDTEAAELDACERSIMASQQAFIWIAGKALETIGRARLYRKTHARFEDYVTEVWGFSAQRAYQLRTAWPAAEGLVTMGVDISRLNEAQMRELAPVIKRHGLDQALMVFVTVTEVATEVDGTPVTAAVVRKVAKELPAGHLSRTDVAERTRMVLTAEPETESAPTPWATASNAALSALRKMAADTSASPVEVLEKISQMQSLLDQMREALAAAGSHGGEDD